ncbi:MAG: DUF1566 domain-containing protein [Candidatus Electrothrix sp. YB6]
MRIFFLFLMLCCCMFSAATVHAEQVCKTDSIPASTPDSQFTDNGDGTVMDSKTGLMWKKCLEGIEGDNCETGSADTVTWQEALQQPGLVNTGGGFAGHTDWRLPNIRELRSLIEEQCSYPAINLTYFPNTPNSYVWSRSPAAAYSGSAWYVYFGYGYSNVYNRYSYAAVRLVRGGQ